MLDGRENCKTYKCGNDFFYYATVWNLFPEKASKETQVTFIAQKPRSHV